MSKQRRGSRRLSRVLGWFAAAWLIAFLMIGPVSYVAQAADPNPSETAPTAEQAQEGQDILNPAELKELKDLRGGTLTPEQITQLKEMASQKLAELGPLAISKLEAKAAKKQEERLVWIALVVVIALPLLGLAAFLAYPLLTRKKLQERVPNVTLGQVYKLYLPQALMVTLVLFVLGGALWGVQLLTGRVMGGVSNPQLVLQREAIQYVIDDREYLIENYSDIMVGLAHDLTDGDPEKPVMDIILDNALQLRDDPVVSFANNIIQFVMPFLNYISLISFGFLLLFFLLRIRPDIMNLVKYPMAILEAEHTGKPLPAFDSVAVGTISAEQNSQVTMRQIGRKLMWNEVKVVACFALAVIAVALLMSLALTLFFYPIVGLLLETVSEATEYFLYVEGASGTLVTTSAVLMLFVIECVLFFLLSFIFALMRLQDALRQRFAGRIDNKQTWTFMRKLGLRFGWLMLLAAGFGMGLPFLADKTSEWLYDPKKGENNDWTLILIGVPVAVLIGFNLGLWLLRGFKTMAGLITKNAAKEFNLAPVQKPQEELAKV